MNRDKRLGNIFCSSLWFIIGNDRGDNVRDDDIAADHNDYLKKDRLLRRSERIGAIGHHKA